MTTFSTPNLVPSTKKRSRPRGQTVIHVLALLYLAYKVHKKVGEMTQGYRGANDSREKE
jgi:hypothetical protein